MDTLTDEKIEEFITLINSLDPDEIGESTTEVGGYSVSVYQEDSLHSEDIVMTLHLNDYNTSFRREGTKEISYERWVDTWWCSWEVF